MATKAHITDRLPLLASQGQIPAPSGADASARRVHAAAISILRNPAFAPSPAAFFRAQKSALLGGRVSAGQDVATDISFVGRGLLGFSADGSTALDTTLGNSTGINAFLGYNSYLNASERAEEAKAVDYHEKANTEHLSRVRSATQMVGGALYFGVRGLSLASYVKGVDTSSATAPTLLGRVTFVLSSVGSALWGAVYALLAGAMGRRLYHAREFRQELDKALESSENLEAFIAKWSCSDINELKAAVCAEGYTPEQLREEALTCQAEVLKDQLKESGLKELTEEDRKEMAYEMVRQEALAGREVAEDVQNMVVNQRLEHLGAKWKMAKLQAMRELKVASMTSKTCADKLFRRDSEAELDPIALIAEMKAEMDKAFWINLGYMVASIIGVGATIAAFVATAGLGPLLVTLAFLVVGLMMTGLDGYTLHEAMIAEKTGGVFDKKMLAMSSVISFLSFVGSIVLISVLSLGTAPLIAAIAIFVFWLGVNAKVWSALPATPASTQDPEALLIQECSKAAKKRTGKFFRLNADAQERAQKKQRSDLVSIVQHLFFPDLEEEGLKKLLLSNSKII